VEGAKSMKRLSVILYSSSSDQDFLPIAKTLVKQMQPYEEFEIFLLAPKNISPEWSAFLSSCKVEVIWYSEMNLARALEMAQGRYCLLLQGDCQPHPGLIANHLILLEEQPMGRSISLGTIEHVPAPGTSLFTEFWCHLQNSRTTSMATHLLRIALPDIQLGNIAFPRRSLSKISIGADGTTENHLIELALLLEDQGFHWVQNFAAKAVHFEKRDHEQLRQEMIRRGETSVKLWRQNPRWLTRVFRSCGDFTPRAIIWRKILLRARISAKLIYFLYRLAKQSRLKNDWFRFFESYCYWQGVQHSLPDQHQFLRMIHGTPILMYHGFGRKHEPINRYVVEQNKFDRQLAILKLLGYKGIRLDDYVCCLREGRLPPDHAVIITIDDGFEECYHLAFPILKRHNLPATIFLISNFMGQENGYEKDTRIARRRLISWENARKIQGDLITFGVHTANHPYLTELSHQEVAREIVEAKQKIEDCLGQQAHLFSYPHGKFDPVVEATVQDEHFWAACSVDPGKNTPGGDLFSLLRIDIRGNHTILQFLKLVILGSR
jgi:peptidoglycan/xylan/chitin deacetylase (PgdA/CDA1 family)